MDQNPDVIRQNIEETRSALTEKLETLETEVFGTVREATSAVSSTVQNVKETVTSTVESVKGTVQGTIQSVKETFDVRHQVDRHPWAMVGGSFAAGFVLGNFLPAAERESSSSRSHRSSTVSMPFGGRSVESTARSSSSPGLLGRLLADFEPELQKVKGMAIGAAIGLIRDVVKERIPEPMVADFEQLVNSLTAKIGGEPVHGSVLDTPSVGGDVSSFQPSPFSGPSSPETCRR